ncbi:MAG: FecR domain-containing protein [Chitinophagales bacterium]|nr:FecR domain-containing protein [Chitinophagales bacterium]
MENNYEHIDALIARRLGGETDADLVRELDAWRNTAPENERYYQQMLQIWEVGPQIREHSTLHFDTETALASVKNRIHPRRRPVVLRMALRAAAALALLLAAYWWFRPGPAAPQEIATTATNTLSDTLTDGSVVTLNRNSALAVSGGFNERERRMRLHGEAYFEVAPNPEKPFVVEVERLEIKVLGTAFNVDNLSSPDKVQINVTHGRVQLSSNGQNLVLTANQAAEYDRQSGQLSMKQVDPGANILAYKTKQFRFEGTRLELVTQQLEQAYGVPVKLGNPALRNCPLSANYNNLPLNRALQLIADSFSLTLEQKPDGSYLLNGSSCEE